VLVCWWTVQLFPFSVTLCISWITANWRFVSDIFVSVWTDLITFIFGTAVNGWSLTLFHSAIHIKSALAISMIAWVHCQPLHFTCQSVLPVLRFLRDELSLQLHVDVMMLYSQFDMGVSSSHLNLDPLHHASSGLQADDQGIWVWIVVGLKQFCLIHDTKTSSGVC